MIVPSPSTALFIALALCTAVSAMPATAETSKNNKVVDLSTVPPDSCKLIGSYAFSFAKKVTLSKSTNMFTEDLRLPSIFRDYSSIGAKLLVHCNGQKTDFNFNSELQEIQAVTRYISAELSRPPVGVSIDGLTEGEWAKIMLNEKLKRLSEFEAAASLYRNLSKDMLTCSKRLNSYEMASMFLTLENIEVHKSTHESFEDFDYQSPTEDQLKKRIDSLQFEDAAVEREKLVLTTVVDMFSALFHSDLIEYFINHDWNACGAGDAGCKGEDDRQLKFLNYISSQFFAGIEVSAALAEKVGLTMEIITGEKRDFYKGLGTTFKTSKDKIDAVVNDSFAKLVMNFFSSHGDFYTHGEAAFANIVLRNHDDWIRNVNDLKIIAANRGMDYLLIEHTNGPEDLYDSARTLSCLESQECDTTEEITEEILVEIFRLPSSLSLDKLKSILKNDHYWDRQMRKIIAELAGLTADNGRDE